MKNTELIISLIQQDLKHSQLVQGLERIGLDGGGLHHLEILEIVSSMLGVPDGKLNDRVGEIYISFMDEAPNYEITSKGETLRPLAELCYWQLIQTIEKENRRLS